MIFFALICSGILSVILEFINVSHSISLLFNTQFMLLLYVLGIAAFGFATTHLPFGWTCNALIMLAASGLLAVALRLIKIKDFVGIITKTEIHKPNK